MDLSNILADDSEYTAVPVHLWTKHVAELHADGDIGFSREYEVNIFKNICLLLLIKYNLLESVASYLSLSKLNFVWISVFFIPYVK